MLLTGIDTLFGRVSIFSLTKKSRKGLLLKLCRDTGGVLLAAKPCGIEIVQSCVARVELAPSLLVILGLVFGMSEEILKSVDVPPVVVEDVKGVPPSPSMAAGESTFACRLIIG